MVDRFPNGVFGFNNRIVVLVVFINPFGQLLVER